MARTQATTGNGYAGTRTSPMPVTASPGQIVSTPAPNPRAFRGAYQSQVNKPQGYGALGDNMPVGVVNGNQTYNYGLQETAPGKIGTILADPRKTTTFSGSTAPTWLTSGGSDGRVGRGGGASTRANGLGSAGGAAYLGGGGALTGGAGGAIGQQLQSDLDKANAANDARYNQALDTNQTGYAGIEGTINAGKAEQQALAAGFGATQKELNNRNTNTRLGQNQQNLIGNGLGNSTVVGSMAKGIQSEGDFQNRAVDEADARLQLGIDQNATNQTVNAQTGAVGQRVGIIGSKTDAGPNIAQYLDLLKTAGAQGGAGAAGAYGQAGNGGGGGGTGFSLNSGDGGGQDQSNPLLQYLQYLMGGQQAGGSGNQSVNGGSSGLGNQPQNQNSVPYYPYGGMPGSSGNVSFDPNGGEAPTYNAGASPTYPQPFLPGEGDPSDHSTGAGQDIEGLRQAMNLPASYPDQQVLQMAKLRGLIS